MTDVQETDDAQALPDLQGHTVGIVDTDAACDAVIQALNAAGFPSATIKVFRGDEGLQFLDRIMAASTWGESAEDVLKQGTVELGRGHSLIFVEVPDIEAAATVARVSTRHGARSIYHFGVLVDTRLTA